MGELPGRFEVMQQQLLVEGKALKLPTSISPLHEDELVSVLGLMAALVVKHVQVVLWSVALSQWTINVCPAE